MTKPESYLPDDIALRLDAIIERVMTKAREEIGTEVGRMFRFANMDEVPAARVILQENEAAMSIQQILAELKAGGIWRPPSGSKGSGADTEILRSLSRAASAAVNLKYVDKDKEIIGLPERD
jgi:hypothetical protein